MKSANYNSRMARQARAAWNRLAKVRGDDTERRVLDAFVRDRAHWPAPTWFAAIARSNRAEDSRGIDFIVYRTSEPVELLVQVKSSDSGREKFELERESIPLERRPPIGVAVILRKDTPGLIRNKVLAAAEESLRLQLEAKFTSRDSLRKKTPLRLFESTSMQAEFTRFAHEIVDVLKSYKQPEFCVKESATEIIAVVGDIKIAFVSARVGEFAVARRMSERIIRFACDSSPSRRRTLAETVASEYYISEAMKTYQGRFLKLSG